jgi:hypothetical protein
MRWESVLQQLLLGASVQPLPNHEKLIAADGHCCPRSLALTWDGLGDTAADRRRQVHNFREEAIRLLTCVAMLRLDFL